MSISQKRPRLQQHRTKTPYRSSVVVFDHHPQQLRYPIRCYVDLLTGLRAEGRPMRMPPIGTE